MDVVLTWLGKYEYLAMVSILVLCGIGLPIPEEFTLLSSGLLVGWQQADFWVSSIACATGILAGDSIIFGLGHHYGRAFLNSRPMHILLPPSRQQHVEKFFGKHGSKALFLARFFPGVRIGVYAYAGSQQVRWSRFFLLDALGVLISCPASILVGSLIAKAGGDREEAVATAAARAHRMGPWLMAGAVGLVLGMLILQYVVRRVSRR